jgi:hypothetical protein
MPKGTPVDIAEAHKDQPPDPLGLELHEGSRLPPTGHLPRTNRTKPRKVETNVNQ